MSPSVDTAASSEFISSLKQHLNSDEASTDVRDLVAALLNTDQQDREAQRQAFLSSAPTLLSLHSNIEDSLECLDSLSEFLTTFSNDLSPVSHQITTLKQRSNELDDQLRQKRALEEPLSRLLNKGVILDPAVVAKIFDSPVDQTWKDVIRQLERSLEATRRPLDQIVAPSTRSRARSSLMPSLSRRGSALSTSGSGSTEPEETLKGIDAQQSLTEARRIAETCKLLAAIKIRAHLVAPFTLLRTSVTTNLQVLQTSVLLPHHQPLYAFLARQMPRIAIDIQRAYVAAARLFFETGFRRYSRALGQIQKRGYKRGQGQGSIVDVPSTANSGFAGFFSGGASSSKSALESADPYVTGFDRLAHGLLSDDDSAPPVVLAYMGDDAAYTAPPEALFRSLSLVFFDNACSEFTFLVRYFEALPNPSSKRNTGAASRRRSAAMSKAARSRSGSATASSQNAQGAFSPSSTAPPTPIEEEWQGDESTIADDTLAEDTLTLEDGSIDGGDADTPSQLSDAGTRSASAEGGNLVQLSPLEQELLKGRGASAELFKKIFEPVLATWLNFAQAILYGIAPSSTAAAASGTTASGSGGASGSANGGGNSLAGFVSSVAGSASSSGPGRGSGASPLPLLPLLTMLRLTDQLLRLAEQRGTDVVLTGPLLQFKMEAWPLAQRKFTEEIDAVSRLAGVQDAKASSSSSSSGSSWWGAFGGGGGSSSSSASAERAKEALKALTEDDVLLIAARYATLFSQIALLTSSSISGVGSSTSSSAAPATPQEDPSSTMLSASLMRLRTAVVALVQAKAAQLSSAGSSASSLVQKTVLRVRKELEMIDTQQGAAVAEHGRNVAAGAKTMREMSWWNEWQRGQAAASTSSR